MKYKTNYNRDGQVMLLTIVIFSATLLSVTTIAGLLTFYQFRQATNVANSIKAIYAAESGLELEFYRWYKDQMNCHDPIPPPPGAGGTWPPGSYPTTINCYPAPTLSNGATFSTSHTYKSVVIASTTVSTINNIKSTGQSVNSARALQANL